MNENGNRHEEDLQILSILNKTIRVSVLYFIALLKKLSKCKIVFLVKF